MSNTQCEKQCAVCCDDNIEEMNAKLNVRLRFWSFVFSSFITSIIIGFHIKFAYEGKTLPIPDIVWPIMLFAWCGEGIAKLLPLLGKSKK
jgi:hypothetical protein